MSETIYQCCDKVFSYIEFARHIGANDIIDGKSKDVDLYIKTYPHKQITHMGKIYL